MSRLGFPQLLKCHLPARDEPLHQIEINSRNILVFLKLRFWPQAPTESSAQFQPLLAQGAELRVSGGEEAKEGRNSDTFCSGLDQTQDFQWSHSGEEPHSLNDSVMVKTSMWRSCKGLSDFFKGFLSWRVLPVRSRHTGMLWTCSS